MESDELIPLSYISQYSYCPRRAGLLLLEQQWADSADTVKGSAEHRNVHDLDTKKHSDKTELTEIYVSSFMMGIAGKCDMVEAYPDSGGTVFPFLDENKYRLYPIEYKHGKLRNEEEYTHQLCAQAMCLEEMYGCKIESGAIFYISSHRKTEVLFTQVLRDKVTEICGELRKMLGCGRVPKPVLTPKCRKCSLAEVCAPEISGSVYRYISDNTKGEAE